MGASGLRHGLLRRRSAGARDAMRRGLIVAKETGNRYFESPLANVLGRLEARHGDPVAALDYLTYAIRNYHDSGSASVIHVPLAALAALLDELERHPPAATIAGFALNSLSAARFQGSDPRLPICGMSSATRPTKRSPARVRRHRRDGDIRIRSDRPGSCRTPHRLEIDHI
jgi:hypothetical protein